jgi:hypothetical protein
MLFGRGKPTVQMFSWSLEIYDSDFLATHKDRGKRVKAINALTHSFDLTIVNDNRFPTRSHPLINTYPYAATSGFRRGSFLFIQGC